MTLTIDRDKRLAETLVEIAKLAEQCRKDADLDQCHAHAEWFRKIRILANEANGDPPSFEQADEGFRRDLVLALATDWTLTVHIDAFADTVVRQADAIIARMKR